MCQWAQAGWDTRKLPSHYVPVHSLVVSCTSTAEGWRGLAPSRQLWDTGRDGVFATIPTDLAAKEVRRNKILAEGMLCCVGTEVLAL